MTTEANSASPQSTSIQRSPPQPPRPTEHDLAPALDTTTTTTTTTTMSGTFIDHKPFLSDKFDVNDYANAVLQGQTYRPDEIHEPSQERANGRREGGGSGEKGDLSVEVAKLNYGIEDVTRQIRQEITNSYPLLLAHLTSSLALSSQLSPIRSSLDSLSISIDRLHTKIHVPHDNLSKLVTRLTLIAQASDLARRAARFVLVARRLEGQMARLKESVNSVNSDSQKNGEIIKSSDLGMAGKDKEKEVVEKENEMAKAALSVAELDSLLNPPPESIDPIVIDHSESPNSNDVTNGNKSSENKLVIPLQSLEFIKAYIPHVNHARDTIIREMENMVVNGLAELDQPLLSSSLQTAHNLRLLPDLVSNLLADLNDAVTLRVQRAFDVVAIGREVAGKESSHSAIKFTTRKSTEPTSATAPQWASILWNRLERVIEDIANCCIKVYTLEKVLKVKRDAVTHVEFLDEVMKKLDEKPSFIFWTTLAKAFEAQSKDTKSTWLQQTLSTGYPRLLRLFHDFFAKIAVHTDTVYTLDQQSPEAVLVLRSISPFETLYLSRSTNRMNEVSTSAMSSYLSARGNPPGAGEGVNIARTITNELDSARFDPLLVRTVARNAVKVLDGLVSRIDGAIVRDFTATSLIGPQATPAQIVNAQFASCLYHCRINLSYLEQQFGVKVAEILQTSIKSLEIPFHRITDPLDAALKRETSAIISRIHKVDFSKPMDPMAGTSSSPYIQDLADKLAYVKSEILGRMSLGDFMKDWVIQLCQHVIRTFLLHASIARPLGESGRLKLTSNMTELEMSLQNLLMTGQVQGVKGGVKLDKIGDEYLALRSFRQLLFADKTALSNPVETVHLPTLVVLHHIIVLSPLRLPHEIHGWSEAEYVAWIGKHESEEAINLLEKDVEGQIDSGSGSGSGSGNVGNEKIESVRLIREVLEHSRHHEEASPSFS